MLALHDYERESSTFMFNGRTLRLSFAKAASQQQSRNAAARPLAAFQDKPTTVACNIEDVFCGTLITESAMRNIRTANGIASSGDGSGVIGHRLSGDHLNVTFKFEVNREKRNFAIVIVAPVQVEDSSVVCNERRFEWTFQE